MIIDNQYDLLINGNDEELFVFFKDFFKIERNNYTEFLNKLDVFHSYIQEKYFNFLQLNVFNFNDNFNFYNNLKNNRQLILNHINQINYFLEDKIFPYITSNFYIENTFIHLSHQKHNEFMIYKKNIIKEILNQNNIPDYYSLNESINLFFNSLNDDSLFNEISKNNVFINLNDKKYLSSFFIKKLSLIFNIDLNTDLNVDTILFEDLYLNNFYLISMKVYDRFSLK